MPYIVDSQKEFERPANGVYTGVLVDVIDLGIVPSKNSAFAAKPKVKIVWALDVKDSRGKNFLVGPTVNSSTHEKSVLFGVVKSILGYFPPPPFDLEMIIGQSKELFVVNEPNADNTRTYSNIKAITVLPAGKTPLAVPAGFVRDKDKPVAERAATKLAIRLAQNNPAQNQARPASQVQNPPLTPGIPGTQTVPPTVQPEEANEEIAF